MIVKERAYNKTIKGENLYYKYPLLSSTYLFLFPWLYSRVERDIDVVDVFSIVY